MDPAPKRPELFPPPQHVAIIMDGNGRWALERRLPRIAGHKKGIGALRRTVTAAKELGIDYLTVYGFSSENWKRPPAEIDDLMGLLRLYLRKELADLNRNGVRLRVIGDRSRLGRDIVGLIENAEDHTRGNTTFNLTLALSYGSRAEIIEAVRRIARDVQEGKTTPEDIVEARFSDFLFTGGLPDPDLVIRTSGEKRLSNFLLWQSAYAELFFTDSLWPDFNKADLEQAVEEYRQRERRYGASGA